MRLLLIGILFSLSTVQAQKGSRMETVIQVGDSTIRIVQQFGSSDDNILFINVHEDEETSIRVVETFSQTMELNFIRLSHLGNRNFVYSHRGKRYEIDPNRIFTSKGRKATLKKHGKFSFRAARMAKLLATGLLSSIEEEKHVVIAMHNNTDVNYSIKSYQKGGDESENTKKVHVSEDWDADDFIYTTVDEYYEKFKAAGLNVILQDNDKCINDGSLSVWCGQRNIPYINIEAQKGHFEEQMKLTRKVLVILGKNIER
jgi:hypothetical protein